MWTNVHTSWAGVGRDMGDVNTAKLATLTGYRDVASGLHGPNVSKLYLSRGGVPVPGNSF